MKDVSQRKAFVRIEKIFGLYFAVTQSLKNNKKCEVDGFFYATAR